MLGEFQKVQRLSASKQREYVDKTKATTAMLQSQQAMYVGGLRVSYHLKREINNES